MLWAPKRIAPESTMTVLRNGIEAGGVVGGDGTGGSLPPSYNPGATARNGPCNWYVDYGGT